MARTFLGKWFVLSRTNSYWRTIRYWTFVYLLSSIASWRYSWRIHIYIYIYRPYGKCYLSITYCFRINFRKVTNTDTDRRLFWNWYSYHYRYQSPFGPFSLICWPIRSHCWNIQGFCIMHLKYWTFQEILCIMHVKHWNFPGIFVHTEYWNFPGIFVYNASKCWNLICAHFTKMLLSENAHEQTPQKPNGGKVVWTEKRERWPLRSCMNRRSTQAGSTTSNT